MTAPDPTQQTPGRHHIECLPSVSPSVSQHPPGRRPETSAAPAPSSTKGPHSRAALTSAPQAALPLPPDPHQKPGHTWLITDRTRPFWTAAHALLADNAWHYQHELIELGAHHGLAHRTVANHLPRASKRRWITRDGNRVRLRPGNALAQALDPDDVGDQPVERGAR